MCQFMQCTAWVKKQKYMAGYLYFSQARLQGKGSGSQRCSEWNDITGAVWCNQCNTYLGLTADTLAVRLRKSMAEGVCWLRLNFWGSEGLSLPTDGGSE